jgi:Rrf2 family protein
MKVSTRVRYAVRALLDIAIQGNDRPVSLREISARQEISLLYLQQLVRPLIAGGLVRSVRGPGGGLLLLKPPAQIRLSDIFQMIEGTFNPVDCVTRDTWAEVKSAVNGVLDSTTLEDLVQRHRKKEELEGVA